MIILLKLYELKDYGVIMDGGNKVCMKGMGQIYNVEKITDEEFAALEDDFDDIEAPPGPYTVQPENQGYKSYVILR